MISRRRAVWILALVVWLPSLADAAGPAAGPLRELQEQVDRLTARLTPPTLSPTVTCSAAFLATIRLDASDNQGIAHYAVQEQGGNPPANFVIFAEPGSTAVSHEVDVEVPAQGWPTRSFLLVAADTDGNVAQTMVSIAPGLCDGS